MAVGDYVVAAVGTLPTTAPGVISTVDVTCTGAAAGDFVVITPTNSVSDTNGAFIPSVTAVTTNKVSLTVDRAQLTTALTVQIVVFDSA
jgi:hypothetical protein